MHPANALCHGGNAGMMGERNGDDAYTHIHSSTSSFTAINQSSTQSLTPPSSTAIPVQQNQARRRAAVHAPRRHNSAVAQYLGLGSAREPTHLEIYAPSTATSQSLPPKPAGKRPRLSTHANTADGSRVNAQGRASLDQRRVSENFRATKSARSSAASKTKTLLSRTTQPVFVDGAQTQRSTVDGDGLTISHQDRTSQICNVTDQGFASPETLRDVSQDTVATLPMQHPPGARSFSLESDDFDASEAEHVDLNLVPQQTGLSSFVEDDFDFDIEDDELLTLISEIGGKCPDSAKHASRYLVQSNSKNDDGLQHKPGSSAGAPIMSDEVHTKEHPRPISKQFTSPVTLKTRLQASCRDSGSSKTRKPIARSSFPKAVRDRSPIIGLSSSLQLKTCFRIGEVISQSHQASKSGKHIMIEMYARVLASERTETEQQFTFCDLFHAKPPYIKGKYNAAIWKSVQLFEYDGRRLLQQGRICRCIGTPKREDKAWTMTVLNVWEATWEDIEWVHGIVDF